MKSFYSKTHLGTTTTIHTILGFSIIFGWAGNCFRHALHFQKGHITLRINLRNEINLYYGTDKNGRRHINWNWDWLARQIGEKSEAPHGDVWIYNGILGHHYDV